MEQDLNKYTFDILLLMLAVLLAYLMQQEVVYIHCYLLYTSDSYC